MQALLTKKIYDEFCLRFPSSRYRVISDQASAWGVPVGDGARQSINLFAAGSDRKSRENWISKCDLCVRDEDDRALPYLVEVETRPSQIAPKLIAGLVCATNMCDVYYPPSDYTRAYTLMNSHLFVVLASRSIAVTRSRKRDQALLIKEKLKLAPGSLKGWSLCLGESDDAAFREFVLALNCVMGEVEFEAA